MLVGVSISKANLIITVVSQPPTHSASFRFCHLHANPYISQDKKSDKLQSMLRDAHVFHIWALR